MKGPSDSARAASGAISARRAWAMVIALSALYFVSFVDRAIIALVVQPLKADLGVSDIELGLLFGPAFAIFFALLGVPFARAADLGDRRRLVAAGALLWGLCTVGSGFVNAYWLLVALRVGLAIGEAALTPAAYSLIGAMFPPSERIRAASIYSAIGVAGVSGAYIVGGQLVGAAERVGFGTAAAPIDIALWQIVLIAAGLPAVAGALLFWAIAREPKRAGAADMGASLKELGAHVRASGTMYPLLFLGAGIIQAITYSYAGWGPEFLRRTFGMGMESAGMSFGLSGLIGASLGALLAPNAARWLQARGRNDAIALVASVCALVGALASVGASLANGPAQFFPLYCLANLGLFGASTGLVVAMQVIAPLRMRATLVAMLLLCMTLLAGLLGPPVVAIASTALSPSGDRLGEALAMVGVGAGGAGVLLLWAARGAVARHMTVAAHMAPA